MSEEELAEQITNAEIEEELRKAGWTDERMKDPEQIESGAVGLAKMAALYALRNERGLR